MYLLVLKENVFISFKGEIFVVVKFIINIEWFEIFF